MLSPFAAIQRRGLDSGRAVPVLAIVEISVVDRMVDRGPEIEIDPRGETKDLRHQERGHVLLGSEYHDVPKPPSAALPPLERE